MNLPILYKKTSTNAIQMWEISAENASITTKHGQVDGKIQTVVDVIHSGKNLGKANETTAQQQAELEAKSKWTKQIERKGYVEDLSRASAGETDAEGGIAPMLAHKFSEQSHKIVYPCYVQPKFDGIRCIAQIVDGKCTLWSRTRKPILSLVHIQQALEAIFTGQTLILDGEAYCDKLANDFEEIISCVRKDYPTEEAKKINYHVYDLASHHGSFYQRWEALQSLGIVSPVILSPTALVKGIDELMKAFEGYLADGYEGAIARNGSGKYENKRSYNLQKVKNMVDSEFKIIGCHEGRGKMAGLAIFECVNKFGKTFDVKMKGKLESLAKYLHEPTLWQGKCLTVQYQNLTNEGLPRFPVGKAVRDYE